MLLLCYYYNLIYLKIITHQHQLEPQKTIRINHLASGHLFALLRYVTHNITCTAFKENTSNNIRLLHPSLRHAQHLNTAVVEDTCEYGETKLARGAWFLTWLVRFHVVSKGVLRVGNLAVCPRSIHVAMHVVVHLSPIAPNYIRYVHQSSTWPCA